MYHCKNLRLFSINFRNRMYVNNMLEMLICKNVFNIDLIPQSVKTIDKYAVKTSSSQFKFVMKKKNIFLWLNEIVWMGRQGFSLIVENPF